MALIHWGKVPVFYHTYLHHIGNETVTEALRENEHKLNHFLSSLPPHKWDYRYAPDKWSIKELVQHLIDAERIFCYRALVFARRDKAVLPGFDENEYAAASGAALRKEAHLKEELVLLRKTTILLFENFDEAALSAAGIANGNAIYVEAIGFIITGHCRHHLRILAERYL